MPLFRWFKNAINTIRITSAATHIPIIVAVGENPELPPLGDDGDGECGDGGGDGGGCGDGDGDNGGDDGDGDGDDDEDRGATMRISGVLNTPTSSLVLVDV